MGEQIKKAFADIKAFWEKQSKKTKTYALAIIGGIIITIFGVTLLINVVQGGQAVLFDGIAREEAVQVMSELQKMGENASLNEDGQIVVNGNRLEYILIELSALGYPKTTTSYPQFSGSTGLTTTEFEKKQYLVFDLEKKIQNTIKIIEGVQGAEVTLNIATDNGFVWEAAAAKSSAGVMITMSPGYKMSSKNVVAIQNLVAKSVPNMLPGDVSVIDASTGIDMTVNLNSNSELEINLQRLGLESEIERRINEKIINVLSLGYGSDAIRVSTTVEIDYDRMITEQMQYIPEDNGKGIESHYDEQTSTDGTTTGGVVGEENNTDIPSYPEGAGGGEGASDRAINIDYVVSYIKKQIEKDAAQLKSSSVSITLVDDNLTDEKKDSIIETAARAGNVPLENISVNNFDLGDVGTGATNPMELLTNPLFLGILAAVGVIFIIIIILLMTGKGKKNKKKSKLVTPEGVLIEDQGDHGDFDRMQREIEQHKLKIKQGAQVPSKENAITNEIRDFASTNPEITASLLRAWIKEDE